MSRDKHCFVLYVRSKKRNLIHSCVNPVPKLEEEEERSENVYTREQQPLGLKIFVFQIQIDDIEHTKIYLTMFAAGVLYHKNTRKTNI